MLHVWLRGPAITEPGANKRSVSNADDRSTAWSARA
jgi:hypothetical protein